MCATGEPLPFDQLLIELHGCEESLVAALVNCLDKHGIYPFSREENPHQQLCGRKPPLGFGDVEMAFVRAESRFTHHYMPAAASSAAPPPALASPSAPSSTTGRRRARKARRLSATTNKQQQLPFGSLAANTTTKRMSSAGAATVVAAAAAAAAVEGKPESKLSKPRTAAAAAAVECVDGAQLGPVLRHERIGRFHRTGAEALHGGLEHARAAVAVEAGRAR